MLITIFVKKVWEKILIICSYLNYTKWLKALKMTWKET